MIEITHEMIARRAFEISLTDEAGTPEENWQRAERELREEAGLPAAPPRQQRSGERQRGSP